MKSYGGVDVWLHAFLTLTWNGESLTLGLKSVEKKKNPLAVTRIEPQFLFRQARNVVVISSVNNIFSFCLYKESSFKSTLQGGSKHSLSQYITILDGC
jgi:hypothetical protein